MKKLNFAFFVLGIMWIVFLIFGKRAISYGLHPRDVHALTGIIFAPFIHANLTHILANSLPIFILTWLLSVFYDRIAVITWFLVAFTGGLFVWLFARSYNGNIALYHVGASGVIFGLIGFFLASGLFRRDLKAILVAIIVGVLYGGALWGMLPTNPYVSWEGHLFGFIAGIIWAYLLRNSGKDKDKTTIVDQ